MKKAFILGVTGVIGSGKTTFCRFLKKFFGFYYIDADSVVHSLYWAGRPGYRKIKDCFGNYFVGRQSIHRGRLRKFLLAHPSKFWTINKLMHPLVAHEVNKKVVQIKREHKGVKRILVCIEAVYFGLKDLGKLVDRVIVVDAPDKEILRRLKKRRMPIDQLKALLQFQRANMSWDY